MNTQVRVLMSGGFYAACQELLPQFENTTGITVTTALGPSQGDGYDTVGAHLRRGVPADLLTLGQFHKQTRPNACTVMALVECNCSMVWSNWKYVWVAAPKFRHLFNAEWSGRIRFP